MSAEFGRVIAHRGASRAAPENTLAAFRAARAARARAVEFDVTLLGDGTAVVFHDATLDRCTNAQGPIAARSRADLAELDAGAWHSAAFRGERIPILADALETLAALGLSANLEMKPAEGGGEAIARAVASEIRRAAVPLLVSSFDLGALAALGRLRPDVALAPLYDEPPDRWVAEARALGAAAMHMDHRRLTRAHLAAAGESGLDLRVYTPNDPAALAPLRLPGLSGVITDDPTLWLADAAWAAWARA